MATKKLTTISRYTGLSTDTKPTSVPVGSTFREYDTRYLWETYDGTNWKIKSIGVGSEAWLFGEPTLYDSHNGNAVWSRAADTENVAAYQKGNTGWTANLYGGLQTGAESFGAVYIPVNELPLVYLTDAKWTYWFSSSAVYGVNMVLWVHDPTDHDKRAEITQTPSGVTLEKAGGWNAHELDVTTVQFFYMGENEGSPGLSEGTGYSYGLDDFQADTVFSSWTIYRISYEFGWYNTGTFGDAWVADITINGQKIVLKPDSTGTGRIGHRFFTDTSGAINTTETLSPRTPFRLLSVMLHLNSAATQQDFTLTCNAARSSVYDTLLYTKAMSGVKDIVKTFEEGLDFYSDDVIDPAWTNSDGRTYGITYTYLTVF